MKSLVPLIALSAGLHFLLAHLFGVGPSLFVLELFLLAPLLRFKRSLIAGAMTFVVSLVAMDSLAQSYFFDLIPFLVQARNLSGDILIANGFVAASVLAILGGAFFVFRSIPSPGFVPSFLLVLLLFGLDAAQGSSVFARMDDRMNRFGNFDVAFSIGNRIALQSLQSFPVVDVNAFPEMQSAVGKSMQLPADLTVLVIVESLGIPVTAVDDPNYGYSKIIARYPSLRKVDSGTVPSVGSTVSGELRELCGRAVPMVALLSDYGACWPKQLAVRGFHTFASHSYRSSFFERRVWWKKVGFDELQFMDTSNMAYPFHKGGVLAGLDDQAMIAGELARVATNDRAFFYHLTSNSHMPVPMGTSVDEMLEDALDDTLAGVSAGIRARTKRRKAGSIRIIVVGDHPPPLMGRERANYVEAKVPFWIFEPA
jgi:hypothetical protein